MKTSNLTRQALKILFGVGLFCAVVYLLLYSNLLTLLEGDNPDGSSSLTWRSGAVAVILFALCLGVASWAFRRRIALAAAFCVAGCVACWYWLDSSKYGFEWEHHDADGTFSLTWRSDLVILGNITIWVFLCLVVRQVIVIRRRRNAS